MAYTAENILGGLSGIMQGLGAYQHARNATDAQEMRRAQLLRESGTLELVDPNEPMSALGGDQGTISIGGQHYRYKPYPMLNRETGQAWGIDLPENFQGMRMTPDVMQRFLPELLKQSNMKSALAKFNALDSDEGMDEGSPMVPGGPQVAPAMPAPPGLQPPQPRAAPRFVQNVSRWAPLVNKYAQQYGIDPKIPMAILQVESGGDPDARSGKDAFGLMQLRQGAAQDTGVNREIPEENIKGGVEYLARLTKQFGSLEKALAAYNTGPGTVQTEGVNPAGQRYIQKVVNVLGGGPTRQSAAAYAPPVQPTVGDVQPVSAYMSTPDRLKLQRIDKQIAKFEKGQEIFASAGVDNLSTFANNRLTKLRKERDDLTQPYEGVRKKAAEGGIDLDIAGRRKRQDESIELQNLPERERIKNAAEVDKAKQLNQVYADRARMELEATADLKERIARASRDEIPMGKENTDKIDALLNVKESVNTIREIVARRSGDPNFMAGAKGEFRQFTGPIQNFWTTYVSQPFQGTDKDENDFVTALRILQSDEIRRAAGLAQTGTEVERQIGFFSGRAPVLSNPPAVFDSRIKGLEDSIDRSLEVQERNASGRALGKWLGEYRQRSGAPRKESVATGPKKGEQTITADDLLKKYGY